MLSQQSPPASEEDGKQIDNNQTRKHTVTFNRIKDTDILLYYILLQE